MEAASHPPRAERLRKVLRRRSLLLRPSEIAELTKIAEDSPTFGNSTKVFIDGDVLYEAMLADISAARSQILFEMYMFESDAIGWEFARALARRAEESLEVRLIYDGAGSLNADSRLFEFLAKSGVHVLEYRPLRPWAQRFGVFGRNHRKILVIDQEIGYLGGVNVARFWSRKHLGDHAWRDTHLRLNGLAALDLVGLFIETWHRETGILLRLIDAATVQATREDYSDDEEGGVFIMGARGRSRRKIRHLYEYEIHQTTKQLLLANSYFVPDRSIRHALYKAVERGVDVRLLLPAYSDVVVADYAGRALIENFLRHGVRVYLYQPRILHAKVMIADHRWATVGSSNFDSLSLNYNLESNAILLDPTQVEPLETQYWDDLKESKEINLESWMRRPLKERFYERLAALFQAWL